MSQFKVSYDQEHFFIRAETVGFLSHEMYAEGWAQVVQLFEKHPACHRLLIVVIDGKIIPTENQHVFVDDFLPKIQTVMHGRTLKYARVIHGDLFNKISTQNLYKQIQDRLPNVTLKDFDAEENAIEWLDQL
ncbi:hypothetical protein SAMN05421780_104118 [Flexibacter flexilis DSM 6793]|uniref:SpoIIAA-like n=1 Tax=Flexibacter flexilis DSM 6793 TaxID=927664 RepID=A0A1I1HWE3_9BACT|nr:hypothetical protein [Flexibacter flexilis]SFC28254.1 hypothetical protein SAMN05421780_104118 [Flexibacter flexilis DSM 6793]